MGATCAQSVPTAELLTSRSPLLATAPLNVNVLVCSTRPWRNIWLFADEWGSGVAAVG